jgi:hypothetical protein
LCGHDSEEPGRSGNPCAAIGRHAPMLANHAAIRLSGMDTPESGWGTTSLGGHGGRCPPYASWRWALAGAVWVGNARRCCREAWRTVSALRIVAVGTGRCGVGGQCAPVLSRGMADGVRPTHCRGGRRPVRCGWAMHAGVVARHGGRCPPYGVVAGNARRICVA